MTHDNPMKKPPAVAESAPALKNLTEPLKVSLAQLAAAQIGSDSVRQMLEGLNREREMLRLAFGPMEELRRSLDAASLFGSEIERARKTFAEFNANFRLPEIAEARSMLQQVQGFGMSAAIHDFQKQAEIEEAIKAMRSP